MILAQRKVIEEDIGCQSWLDIGCQSLASAHMHTQAHVLLHKLEHMKIQVEACLKQPPELGSQYKKLQASVGSGAFRRRLNPTDKAFDHSQYFSVLTLKLRHNRDSTQKTCLSRQNKPASVLSPSSS